MCNKRTFNFNLMIVVLGFTLFFLSILAVAPVYAQSPDGGQSPDQGVDNGTCINCHEDLYFNHEKGQWFCIRESSMNCVYCHGGNPTANTKERAHYDRSAHPVVNEDISVCRECHVEGCMDCVSEFDRVAGIKEVKLAAPVVGPQSSDQIPCFPAVEKHETVNWLILLDIIVVIAIVSLAIMFYAIRKARQS